MYRFFNKLVHKFNNIFPVMIFTPNYSSFGNSAEDIKYSILKGYRENKKIILAYPSLKIFGKRFHMSNVHLFKLEHPLIIKDTKLIVKVVCFLVSIYGVALYCINNIRVFFFKNMANYLGINNDSASYEDHSYSKPFLGRDSLWTNDLPVKTSLLNVFDTDWISENDKYIPPSLSNSQKNKSKKILGELGLCDSNWFVCLHIKEEIDPKAPRKNTIKNYLPAIKLIISYGGVVIRIGDKSHTKLPKIAGLIDYAHEGEKNQIVDLYVISHCKFFFGSQSGPSAIATMLFARPCIFINMIDMLSGMPVQPGDLALFKHVYLNNQDKELSIEEIFNQPFELLGEPGMAKEYHNEYYFIENSSDEICCAAKEYLDRRDSNYNITELQNNFLTMRKKTIMTYISNGDHNRKWIGVKGKRRRMTELFKLISISISSRGVLCDFYLKKIS